jgi:hypothetical protein
MHRIVAFIPERTVLPGMKDMLPLILGGTEMEK